MKKLPKPRKGAWFVKVRGSYLPASKQGWLSYIPYILLAILGYGGLISRLTPSLWCDTKDICAAVTIGSASSAIILAVIYEAALLYLMTQFAKSKS